MGERRKVQSAGKIDQHFLPRTNIAIERDDRMTNRIGDGINFGDRPVEQRDCIVALKVSRVRQYQIGKLNGFRFERIGDDEKRYFVFARVRSSRMLFTQHVLHTGRIHRRVPRHVCHEQNQGIDRIRIGVDGVGDHHVHGAVCGERRLPRISMIDSQRFACGINRQVFRTHWKAQWRLGQRLIWRVDNCQVVFGQLCGRNGPRVGSTRTEIAGAFQRAKQHLNQMQRAAGLKAV